MKKPDPVGVDRMSAAEAGLIKFLGNPCGRCQGSIRYTVSGECVACAYKRSRGYAKKVNEKLRLAKSQKSEG